MDELMMKLVVDAKADAAVARRMAEEAIGMITQLKANLIPVQPSMPYSEPMADPFVPEEEPQFKVSPFALGNKALVKPVQTVKEASIQVEKGISDEEEVKNHLWDEATAG